MKFLLCIALLMPISLLAEEQEKEQKELIILDAWGCGSFQCGVATDGEKIYLVMADAKGLHTVIHHGKIIWSRKSA